MMFRPHRNEYADAVEILQSIAIAIGLIAPPRPIPVLIDIDAARAIGRAGFERRRNHGDEHEEYDE
jgi:hypothetical protein